MGSSLLVLGAFIIIPMLGWRWLIRASSLPSIFILICLKVIHTYMQTSCAICDSCAKMCDLFVLHKLEIQYLIVTNMFCVNTKFAKLHLSLHLYVLLVYPFFVYSVEAQNIVFVGARTSGS